jgi:predicted hotdog family 3-hydroxylacyl-ACP dehydratase
MAMPNYTIEEAVPHAHPMILLDRLIDCTVEELRAGVKINPSVPFFRPGGVPAHIAIEYMAQACGAYVGVEALAAGRTPRIGLLLGTRNFVAQQKWFPDGSELTVIVENVYREDEMGVFDCRVANAINDDTLASARLTVYQPSEESGFESIDG